MPAYYDNNDQSSEEGYRPSVRIRFPTPMLLRIDQIANSGRFMDRSEAIHEPPDMNRQQSRAQAVQQRASLAAAAKKASSYPASTVTPDDPTLSELSEFQAARFRVWRAPAAGRGAGGRRCHRPRVVRLGGTAGAVPQPQALPIAMATSSSAGLPRSAGFATRKLTTTSQTCVSLRPEIGGHTPSPANQRLYSRWSKTPVI